MITNYKILVIYLNEVAQRLTRRLLVSVTWVRIANVSLLNRMDYFFQLCEISELVIADMNVF